MPKQNLHYYNGKWVRDEKLTVSVFDLSVLRGFGVFDFFRTWNRKLLSLDDNIKRFHSSAKILGLKVPLTKDQSARVIKQGLRKNPHGDINIRMILTGGVSVDHITPGEPNLIILFTEASLLPARYYTKGIKIITQPTPRTYAAAKSLNYLAGVKAIQRARKVGAIEALYVDPPTAKRQHLYEGITSNFFGVRKNKLITADSEVLFGITRKLIIEEAQRLGFQVEQRPVLLKEIKKFDEAFLTASNKGVLPVIQIDEQIIGKGFAGPITKEMIEVFQALTGAHELPEEHAQIVRKLSVAPPRRALG